MPLLGARGEAADGLWAPVSEAGGKAAWGEVGYVVLDLGRLGRPSADTPLLLILKEAKRGLGLEPRRHMGPWLTGVGATPWAGRGSVASLEGCLPSGPGPSGALGWP